MNIYEKLTQYYDNKWNLKGPKYTYINIMAINNVRVMIIKSHGSNEKKNCWK